MTSYTRQMLDLPRHKDSIGIICYQCRTLIPIGSEVVVPARDSHYKKTYHKACAKRINPAAAYAAISITTVSLSISINLLVFFILRYLLVF